MSPKYLFTYVFKYSVKHAKIKNTGGIAGDMIVRAAFKKAQLVGHVAKKGQIMVQTAKFGTYLCSILQEIRLQIKQTFLSYLV